MIIFTLIIYINKKDWIKGIAMAIEEIVLVKSFPNEPLLRCVFGEQDDGVMLCLEEELSIWEQKGIRPLAVKCPKTRVFEYDDELFKKLKEAAYTLEDQDLLEALWEKARIYDRDRTLVNGVSSNVT